MKKIAFIFYFVIAFSVAFYACRKDPKPGNTETNSGVHVLDPKSIFPKRLGMPQLPADNPLTEEGVYLGRMLFYDPILSMDSTISCASCHFQDYAFADFNKLSTGINNLKTGRNAPGLFNLAYSKVFFWDARQQSLRNQVFEPIQAHNEMGMTLPLLEYKLKTSTRYKDAFKKAFEKDPTLVDMSLALEQFMLTLVSNDAKFNDFFPGKFSVLNDAEARGALLFNNFIEEGGADCSHCHGGQLVQQNNPNAGGIANNGLDLVFGDKGFGAITGIAGDMGTFKTPSLMNIGLTAPYMHDGRFKTLEDVINHYSDSVEFNSPTLHPIMKKHQPNGQRKLTAQEKADLKAYLLTMTDNKFLSNPAYSNPFK
ncbi:MAG: c-type cytochrome [Bacteroidetes bacterium]|nr:c-type cytochrome [Bacteroidota bacterium]